MTTIIYDPSTKTVAADRRITAEDSGGCGEVTKIAKCKNGDVCAAAGNAFGFIAWREWADGDRKESPQGMPEGTTGILIKADGSVWEWEAAWLTSEAKFFAWGTGREAALGALYAGASPKRAVEIAALIARDCGDSVDILTLD